MLHEDHFERRRNRRDNPSDDILSRSLLLHAHCVFHLIHTLSHAFFHAASHAAAVGTLALQARLLFHLAR